MSPFSSQIYCRSRYRRNNEVTHKEKCFLTLTGMLINTVNRVRVVTQNEMVTQVQQHTVPVLSATKLAA